MFQGETKVSKLAKLGSASVDYEDTQAENLRSMFLAMSEDYRIIFVKLADRLHNMRTLQYLPPEKKTKIAWETLEIYAPLADRLGVRSLKAELEDLSFK
jgi:(p)ppGpp synthase/HD superfamily hydrolase